MTYRIATKEESAEFWKNRPKSLGDGSIISTPLSGERKAYKRSLKETKIKDKGPSQIEKKVLSKINWKPWEMKDKNKNKLKVDPNYKREKSRYNVHSY